MKFNTLLLAGAAALSLGLATHAQAETIYTTTGAPVAVSTTTSGHEVVQESYTAVGTRKVGLVGYHPYPLQASHVESNTVRVSEPRTVTYTSVPGANVSSSTSVTTTTASNGAPIAYSTGGGAYYTEDGTPYYRDPALNIMVRGTGSFND